MENVNICPICGCNEIAKGRQTGQAAMYPMASLFKASIIVSEICTECGHILSSKVEKPEIFKSKK
ncbi:transcription initiation factor TFIIIB [Neobacillus pocheonensis]|uniref:transcription initiation factor TFIIIB n=1 Tax=Neobacillus pocheonensis TaxID=363869 RepID=UPI003D2B2F75